MAHSTSVPRASGDKPPSSSTCCQPVYPRASGDKPVGSMIAKSKMPCSPRQRG
ncbi:hypothetical protein IC125_001608 [Salmonella enterica]|nr:hypothetical protein [Salmonella enterica]EGF6577784.1 hypothetical protein [Salmonella enterica]